MNAVKVLEVLEAAAECAHSQPLTDSLNEARAAVAELVEAASNPVLFEDSNNDNWKVKATAKQRLRNALKAVRGEA